MSDAQIPCPHCGALIPADASFCRHCGSSDSDGWKEADESWDASDDFDYDEYVADEFSDSPVHHRVRPVWQIVAVVLLILFILMYVL